MLIRRRSVLTDALVNSPPSGDTGNKRKKTDKDIADEPHNSKKARRDPTLLDALFDLPNELSQEVLANSYFIGYEIFIKPWMNVTFGRWPNQAGPRKSWGPSSLGRNGKSPIKAGSSIIPFSSIFLPCRVVLRSASTKSGRRSHPSLAACAHHSRWGVCYPHRLSKTIFLLNKFQSTNFIYSITLYLCVKTRPKLAMSKPEGGLIPRRPPLHPMEL